MLFCDTNFKKNHPRKFLKKKLEFPFKNLYENFITNNQIFKKKNRNFKLHVGYCNNQTKINFPRKMREPILVGDIIT